MLMSVLLVLTTVNNSVPTLQEDLYVDAILDIGCWLMDTSVKVLVIMHMQFNLISLIISVIIMLV